jgi:hypothetical protein
MPGLAVISLSVGGRGAKDTVGEGGLGGASISSDATGFTAGGGGIRLLISVAFGSTEGGRRAARLFVLPAVPGGEIDEDTACPSGLVGTSFVVLMTSVSWALLKINEFGGGATSAGTPT